MADAQASFALTLDSSGLRSGVDSGLSALDRMRQRIQQQTKALSGIKTAMAQLKASSTVQRFEAIPKDLERAQAEAKKLESQLAKNRERQAANQAKGFSDIGLEKESKTLESQIGGVAGRIKQLSGEYEKLKGDETVKAYIDQGKAAKTLEGELSGLQTEYARAGGDASKLADKIEEPKAEITSLMDQAKAAGGPIGNFASKLEGLGGAAKAAGPLALLAVIIAIAAAAIKAAYAIGKMILVSADAARSAKIATSAAAFGSSQGIKEIDAATSALRSNTSKSKEEARALATELYRAGERGQNLEDAALTIGRFAVLGDDAASSVKSLYDELRKPTPSIGGVQNNSMVITKDMLPRDVFLDLANALGKDANKALVQGFTANKAQIRQALSRIGENRFAGPALEQMRSLDKLGERLRENLQSLFEKVKIGVFLGALQKLVNLLDESSESGKAIREALGAIAQPFADAVEAAIPYIEAFFEGIILGGLLVTLALIKVKNALSGLIPSSFTKNIDWLQVAFYVAMGAVVALAVAFGVLAFAVLAAASPFLILLGTIIAIGIAIIMAIDAIVGWFDEVSAKFEEIDFADAVQSITDGIIQAVENSATDVWNAFKDLAKGGLNAFKSALGIKSPSLAFRLAGRDISRGAALGIEDESGKAQTAVANMVSADSLEGGVGGKSGNGQDVTINVEAGAIVINGATEPQTTLEYLERSLAQILRRAALASGRAPEPEAV